MLISSLLIYRLKLSMIHAVVLLFVQKPCTSFTCQTQQLYMSETI